MSGLGTSRAASRAGSSVPRRAELAQTARGVSTFTKVLFRLSGGSGIVDLSIPPPILEYHYSKPIVFFSLVHASTRQELELQKLCQSVPVCPGIFLQLYLSPEAVHAQRYLGSLLDDLSKTLRIWSSSI